MVGSGAPRPWQAHHHLEVHSPFYLILHLLPIYIAVVQYGMRPGKRTIVWR